MLLNENRNFATVITTTTDPNTDTIDGLAGQLIFDTTTAKLYVCVADGNTNWELVTSA